MGRDDEDKEDSGPVYKTKVVQFFNRSVPIVLQNDNGPCPLLAICNVLLLRNAVNLSTEITEVSSSKLLSLIAETLIDTNVINGTKSEEYERNQQQNIADAMQTLPRLATGIDVNVRFRHIHDFEFTPECAIFDLFDIGLVHGWLIDPQDKETSDVIGANSYNTLMEKLVALQASNDPHGSRGVDVLEEPTVDFAAATTATLGVPTPSASQLWSSETSFEELTNEMNQEEMTESAKERRRKGDSEEARQLLQALQLSQGDGPQSMESQLSEDGDQAREDNRELETQMTGNGNSGSPSEISVGSSGNFITPLEVIEMPEEVAELGAREENSIMHEPGVSTETRTLPLQEVDGDSGGFYNSVEPGVGQWLGQELPKADPSLLSLGDDPAIATEHGYISFPEFKPNPSIFALGDDVDRPVNLLDVSDEDFGNQSKSLPPNVGLDETTAESMKREETTKSEDLVGGDGSRSSIVQGPTDRAEQEALSSLSSRVEHRKQPHSHGPGSSCSSRSLGSSGLEDEEPLYEGEDDLANQGGSNYGDKEPLYEGEVILAEQASGSEPDHEQSHLRNMQGSLKQTVAISDREGTIIENFLYGNASQLTICGLFGLVENLKELELCVFFRNNHFSTMFKRQGKLLLLASDQGYLHQPVVWEQLDSVDGDTVFLKGDFTPFTAEEHNGTWNEQVAVAETADYISSRNVVDEDSDLQLALALQQQELEQQQQQQQQQTRAPASSGSSVPPRQASTLGATRMVIGPAKPSTPKPDPVKKEKQCTIM